MKFYELDGEWYHDIAMNTIKRGGKRGEYLRASRERAVVHKFNQYRYIRFLNRKQDSGLTLNYSKCSSIQNQPLSDGWFT